ncbi:hypothetical protein C8Q77DRAFT_435153 [Trametes polyzona]|nr:hypothetical protein C8Q77DRAFT_435153 [Trametes polyzona]
MRGEGEGGPERVLYAQGREKETCEVAELGRGASLTKERTAEEEPCARVCGCSRSLEIIPLATLVLIARSYHSPRITPSRPPCCRRCAPLPSPPPGRPCRLSLLTHPFLAEHVLPLTPPPTSSSISVFPSPNPTQRPPQNRPRTPHRPSSLLPSNAWSVAIVCRPRMTSVPPHSSPTSLGSYSGGYFGVAPDRHSPPLPVSPARTPLERFNPDGSLSASLGSRTSQMIVCEFAFSLLTSSIPPHGARGPALEASSPRRSPFYPAAGVIAVRLL